LKLLFRSVVASLKSNIFGYVGFRLSWINAKKNIAMMRIENPKFEEFNTIDNGLIDFYRLSKTNLVLKFWNNN